MRYSSKYALGFVFITAWALMSVGREHAWGEPLLTDADINLYVLTETAGMTTGMLVQSFGLSADEHLDFTRLLCFAISGVNVILLGPTLSSG